METPALVVAEGYPREGHLPAVQIARDAYRRSGQFVRGDVVSARECCGHLRREGYAAVEAYRLGDVAAYACGAVVDVADRVVHRIVESYVPRQREVIVGVGHVLPSQDGVHRAVRVIEGIHVFGRDAVDVVYGGLFGIVARFERVAETPSRVDYASEVSAAPCELVVADTFGRDLVWVERGAQVDSDLSREGRAQRQRYVRELHRVSQKVIRAAYREVVDKAYLLYARRVAFAEYLGLEALREREAHGHAPAL